MIPHFMISCKCNKLYIEDIDRRYHKVKDQKPPSFPGTETGGERQSLPLTQQSFAADLLKGQRVMRIATVRLIAM